MMALYRIRGLFRWLFRRAEVERAIADDLDDYIERSAAEKIRGGMAPDAAVRAARLELGGVEQTKDEVRAALAFGPFDTLVRDVRYAVRSFRAHKTFTAVMVLCLALGIGANTTVFSFLDSILLRALPVRDPDSLVMLLWSVERPGPEVQWPGMQITSMIDDGSSRVSSNVWGPPVLELFAEEKGVVADMIGRVAVDQIIVDDGEGPLASGTFVTGNYFSGLGVRPVAGRLLGMEDDSFDAPPAVVLEEDFAISLFGSAIETLGRTLRLNGVTFTVVGVTPSDFFGIDPTRSPDFFIPMRSGPLFQSSDTDGAPGPIGNTPDMYQQPNFYWMSAVARLRPGVTPEQATAVLGTKFDTYFEANAPNENSMSNPPVLRVERAGSGFDSLRIEYREPLFVLFSMVLLILAVTCAGVASLQLSRASARRPEMAVRLSLGAGRASLIRQLLTESVLLACFGGLLGVLLSIVGIDLLSALLTIGHDDRALRASLSWPVLGFTAGVSIMTGVLFGVAPALHATRVDVFPVLKGSRSVDADSGRPGRRFSFGQVLVVAQIALSLVLLIGASLFAATLANIRGAELGYNPDGLLFATVNAGRGGYDKDGLVTFYQSLRSRLADIPGVERVTYSWSPLAGGGTFGGRVTVPGTTDEPEPINIQIVGEEFFETLEIPMLRGNAFTQADIDGARAVGIVDERFSETYFPGVNPVGRTIEVVGEGELTIIGVAAEARQDTIRADLMPVVYYTYTWDPHDLPMTFFELRTRGDPRVLADPFRRAVRDLDATVVVAATRTHTDEIDHSIYREIVFARLSEAFAGLALLIACVALYGTVSYAMGRRTPEIGIRMALGASRGRVLRQAFRQVLALGIAGLVLGVPAAIVASNYIESFLWGVAPYEPGILTGAALAVLAAVAIAGYAPARRASHIDPMAALRSE